MKPADRRTKRGAYVLVEEVEEGALVRRHGLLVDVHGCRRRFGMGARDREGGREGERGRSGMRCEWGMWRRCLGWVLDLGTKGGTFWRDEAGGVGGKGMVFARSPSPDHVWVPWANPRARI